MPEPSSVNGKPDRRAFSWDGYPRRRVKISATSTERAKAAALVRRHHHREARMGTGPYARQEPPNIVRDRKRRIFGVKGLAAL